MLEADTLLLRRHGTTLPVPRRVFDLLAHLIQHRHRAVSRDSLILKLWARENVSYHQLAQVVLAARQLLDDSGSAQRWIRTVAGFGYHFVGTVDEVDIPDFTSSRQNEVPAPAAPALKVAEGDNLADGVTAKANVASSASRWAPRRYGQWCTSLAMLALTGTLIWRLALAAGPARTVESAAPPAQDALAVLRHQLQHGRLTEVREGLARLPEVQAMHPSATLLQIELNVQRGQLKRAQQRITTALLQAEGAGDRILQARLLNLRFTVHMRDGRPSAELLAIARRSARLLEPLGSAAAPPVALRAETAQVLGQALMFNGDPAGAQTALLQARELYKAAVLPQEVLSVDAKLARLWMRQGRLVEAEQLLQRVIKAQALHDRPLDQLFSLNTVTRIQIALLRWPEALASSDAAMRLLRDMPDSERRARTEEIRAWVLVGLGRLREAASLLEEGSRSGSLVPALYALAVDDSRNALQAATAAMTASKPVDPGDVLFEDTEGATLLWLAAARMQVRDGGTLPELPALAQPIVRAPQTQSGQIAKGLWLALYGAERDAQAALERAIADCRDVQHRYQLLWATEALIDLHLQRGDPAGAQSALNAIRGEDPGAFDGDYVANLLSLRINQALGGPAPSRSAAERVVHLAGERRLPVDFAQVDMLAAH